MRTLDQLFEQARLRDSLLTPEMYRDVLAEMTPILREQSKRDLFPITEVNDPGVIKSRRLNIVDIGEADFGPEPTGGTFDKPDLTTSDELVMRAKKSFEIPDIELRSAGRAGFDFFREAVQLSTERILLKENKAFTAGLGKMTGIAGITYDNGAGNGQTFAAGAAWTTAGQAWKDLVKAVDDKLANKDAPEGVAALALHPTDYANLKQVFSNTSNVQLDQLRELLPGGIRKSKDLTAGSPIVYARTKSVVELKVYEPLHLIPLPRLDEAERGRVRSSMALHIKQKPLFVKITGA